MQHRETLVNAFRHSKAPDIEFALVYKDNEVRVIIRDIGRGIEPQLLDRDRGTLAFYRACAGAQAR